MYAALLFNVLVTIINKSLKKRLKIRKIKLVKVVKKVTYCV